MHNFDRVIKTFEYRDRLHGHGGNDCHTVGCTRPWFDDDPGVKRLKALMAEVLRGTVSARVSKVGNAP